MRLSFTTAADFFISSSLFIDTPAAAFAFHYFIEYNNNGNNNTGHKAVFDRLFFVAALISCRFRRYGK